LNTISLTSVAVHRSLILRAGGNIQVTGLQQTSSALVSDVASETASVSVAFSGTYVGTWEATSTATVSAAGGSCQNDVNRGTGLSFQAHDGRSNLTFDFFSRILPR
jgi:hypothetical protein